MSLTLTVLTVVAAWYLLRTFLRFLHWRRLELAIPGPPSLPILGNLMDFVGVDDAGRLNLLLWAWAGRRELARISLGQQLVVIVSDPEDVAVVLKEARFAEKPSFFYGFLEGVSGSGLLTTNGQVWRQHRATVLPAFHPAVVDEYAPVFAEEAVALVRNLAEVDGDLLTRELTNVLARASIRTILASDVLPEDEPLIDLIVRDVGQCLKDVSTRTFQPWLWPDATFAMTAMCRRLSHFNKTTNEFGSRVLARIRSRLQQQSKDAPAPKRRTFAEILAESSFSDEEILNEGKTLFGASVETNVATLSLVLKVLSVRQDVQDRVHAELQSVLQDDDITAEHLRRLPYMDSVIKETLRLLPSFPFVARTVREETELAGKTVPAGAVLLVNIFGLHRDPRHHRDPLRFDPERFLVDKTSTTPTSASERHPYSYLPFSAGPRNCIGQRYAMLAVKSVLAVLVRAFRVEATEDAVKEPSDFPLTFYLSLHVVGGVSLRFTPRT